ncbi:argininosuccinate synthase [Thermanaerovibrio acidaminovorans]|jgi:argininosuccinate synthase|uniref:Argininosuccinate synthase n=1 Tax=Thermanaerovibrio acidaminovorans (strain ATCC 49978 / DSM 6589 / Su883) TaxID=525903 RepID=D1B9N3_THEAS|nr:argininosuccinate synthase [Thermanaerovibrio acidaminovorans]ACZ18986.1 argininosuccinate synthase [Thermanaerovibrio acidaminovorans DSM 6589]
MTYKGKLVLAYSGGLDTSVAIPWLKEQGYEVITFTADVGQPIDLEGTKAKAIKSGASKAYIADLREEFVEEFVWRSLKANAMYQGTYPLNSALSRPLIASHLVKVAEEEGAVAIAHGCTGKGQDQVRIEVCAKALNPDIVVEAPVRDWHFSRDEEIEYAEKHGIPIPVTKSSPYSIDENLWGRSIECGILEDPWEEAPSDAFKMTVDPWDAPDEPVTIEIGFEKGLPVSLNGKPMSGVALIEMLNQIAGKAGVGRIDMIEDRLVGFKSREVYECPGAVTLIGAHKALETLTLPKEVLKAKRELEVKYAELTYEGYWFSPLKDAIDAFIDKTQEVVSGVVKVRLFKGQAMVVGMKSPNALYREDLATYSHGDKFDHKSAVGFITVWGLPIKTWSQMHGKKSDQVSKAIGME